MPWCFASGGDVGSDDGASDDGASPVVDSEGVAFVHLFEWSWADVATECEDFLGPKGFTAVQVSPPMEHITGDQWWTRYQPVSYNLTSRSGDQAGFEDMTARCAAAGVQIYADGVVNHMAAAPSSSAQGTGGTYYGPGRKFEPYNYDPEMMHHTSGNSNSNCAVTDYTDLTNVQECDLVGLVDLNTEEDAVRQTIGAYITKLHTLGASGVRIDAAKHINTDSLGAFLGYAPSDMFVFQEVIYGAGGEPSPVCDVKATADLGRSTACLPAPTAPAPTQPRHPRHPRPAFLIQQRPRSRRCTPRTAT